MKIKKLKKLGYQKVYEAALKNQEEAGNSRDDSKKLSCVPHRGGFVWSDSNEGYGFWWFINNEYFKEAFEICPYLKEDSKTKVLEDNTELIERIQKLEDRIEKLDKVCEKYGDSSFESMQEGENKKEQWGDFPIEGYYVNSYSQIYNLVLNEPSSHDKNVWPTKELAQASLALSELTQWMRRPQYNGAWEPDWDNKKDLKYVIRTYLGKISTANYWTHAHVIALKSEEIRDQFLEDHRELIEIAKPLL